MLKIRVRKPVDKKSSLLGATEAVELLDYALGQARARQAAMPGLYKLGFLRVFTAAYEAGVRIRNRMERQNDDRTIAD